MALEWDQWNTGRKVIALSVCVAGLSLFLRFVDHGPFSQNGFTSGFWKGYLMFMGVPFALVWLGKPINVYAGIICGLIGVIGMYGHITQECAVTIGGRDANIAGTGAYIMGISNLAMAIGVWMDRMESK